MQPHSPISGVPILEVQNIRKSFAGVKALVDVSLTLRSGEVHALMGENGAGKSTLMKILAGLHTADSGTIALDGIPIAPRSPHEAIRNGIVMIHQELMPVPDLTVAENILLGHEPASRFSGWINRRAMLSEARRLLGLLEIDLPLRARMRRLSVAEMQTVEIARALGRNARVLIMDEPTASISDREVEALLRVIAMLKRCGVAIVYITHKMDEVFRVADTITVLRDGSHVGTYLAKELDRPRLIALMVGRSVDAAASRPLASKSETALSVRALRRRGAFRDVSFDLARGEILGITGLMGAGRTELVSAIFGLAPAETGEICVAGRPVRIRRPADAIGHGIGMVTEDRKRFGLVPTMPVMHNATLTSLGDCCLGPFVRHARETSIADTAIRDLAIKTSGGRQAISQLSGGNQQKVVMARSLLARPKVLILDEPTRGIDVGAKAEVHALIGRLAQQGTSIILVSSELPEVLALSHRLLVMRQGAVAAELDPSRTSQEEILKYAMPL
jgi:inositol transport system ATP-binding protein